MRIIAKRRYAFFVGALSIFVIIALFAPKWFDHWQEAGRLERKNQTISNFRQHQSQYLALITKWRNTFKSLDPCGEPSPSPGTVEFGAFGIKPNGSLRVGIGLDDKVLANNREVANTLKVEQESVDSLVTGLLAVGRDTIIQSDAEINIPS